MKTALRNIFTIFISIFVSIQASPFDLTDAYVNTFKAGLDDLHGLSHSYVYQEPNLSITENETEIATGE